MSIREKTKIIAVYSPQGGAGKTTIAVNTAILGAFCGLKMLLVDFSTYGNVMSVLKIPQKAGYGLPSIATFLDLDLKAADSERFKEVVSGSIVKKVINDNLDVLLSINPIRMEAITENYISAILNSLKKLSYDFVVVDTTSDLNCRNLILLEEANYVILPAVQDVSCGWKMLLFREVMDKYLLDKDKFGIVINKCSSFSGFSNSEFETEIGYKIINEIPFFVKNYQNYINRGYQIHHKKNKKAYRCFDSVAKQILNMAKKSKVQ